MDASSTGQPSVTTTGTAMIRTLKISKLLSSVFGAALLLPLVISACDGEVGDATVGDTTVGDSDPNNTSSTSQATDNPQTTDQEPDTTSTTGETTGCDDPNIECMCEDDSACPPSSYCEDGVCVEWEMTTSTTGEPTGSTGNACQVNEDCPPGSECIEGECLNDPMTTGSTGDPTGDPTGSTTGDCGDPNILCCETDNDCPPGQLCGNGVCEGEGSTGDPGVCGDGVVDFFEECDDGNNIPNDGCEPDCTLSGQCNDPNDPNCCQDDSECAPGEICDLQTGMCLGGGLQCNSNADCPPMMQCANGLCI